jgi:deoxycytidylate deaminase
MISSIAEFHRSENALAGFVKTTKHPDKICNMQIVNSALWVKSTVLVKKYNFALTPPMDCW